MRKYRHKKVDCRLKPSVAAFSISFMVYSRPKYLPELCNKIIFAIYSEAIDHLLKASGCLLT